MSRRDWDIMDLAAKLIDTKYQRRRFTAADILADVFDILGEDKDDRKVRKFQGRDIIIDVGRSNWKGRYRDINTVLQMTDANGHRIFLHSVTAVSPDGRNGRRVWFNRELATKAEKRRFGEYLVAKGKRHIREGRYWIKEGRDEQQQRRAAA